MTESPKTASGLEDVVASKTVLSDVDGLGGRLTIRGHALSELAGRRDFASVAHLLFDGFFDDLPGAAELAGRLGAARLDVFERLRPALPMLAGADVHSGMRAGMALLPDGDTLEDALRLVAAPAVLTPALIRIEAGGLDLSRKPESIEALFADVLGEASGIAWGPLDVACEPGLVVELDRDRIEQVLVNLVGNARKYGPPEGTIRVRARTEGGDALLTVADQGPGVAAEDREVIFDRFFRAETATRSTQAGLGLGLYICKTIVERHGGRIWVEPGEGGSGARFCIRLPGAPVERPEPPQPTA